MSLGIFLSHNHDDKPFVRRLAADLENQGLIVWLDEAELKVGDSLIEKIRGAIDEVDYVAVVLSPSSVASVWVQRELDVAMTQEIMGRKLKVLPILYRECDLPGFLLGKVYADFTAESSYIESLERLVRSVGIVFNRSAFSCQESRSQLGNSPDRASLIGLSILSSPFYRPFQYIGMPIAEAAEAVGKTPNNVGNIIVDTAKCHMLLEAEGNFISYVDVELKETAPHYQSIEFDSEILLGALSINPSELDLARRQTHFHTYYDHRRKLKISVSCSYDGAPLSIGFSSKYYGM